MIGLLQQKLATSFFSVNLLYDDKFSLCVSPVYGGASGNGTVLYYLIVKGRNHIYYCTLQPMYQNPFQRYYCIFKCDPKPFKVIAFSHMFYILQNFAVKIVFIAFYDLFCNPFQRYYHIFEMQPQTCSKLHCILPHICFKDYFDLIFRMYQMW